MSKEERKKLLKLLPIWEPVDRFRVDLHNLEHQLKSFSLRLEQRESHISHLPKLDADKKRPAVQPPKEYHKDQDIVKIYRKLEDGGIQFYDDPRKRILEIGSQLSSSRLNNTARKSTARRPNSPRTVKISLDGRAVEEDRENIEDLEDNIDMKNHKCSSPCLNVEGVVTETSIDNLIESFRDESDLKVPLLLGWKRRLVRAVNKGIVICYEAPCGKIFKQPFEIRRYLQRTRSKFDIDYFSFDRNIELNSKVGQLDCYYFKKNIAVDARTGKPLENKFISLMNQYNKERLPMDFEYRNLSFPHAMLKDKGFSFNYDFKSGCDCENDCEQRASCACHRLNEEAFGRVRNTGAVEERCQYKYKRLNHQVGTGIFECNSFCKCSSKCSNRVVQNGVRFRLQVQKTVKKGWGVVTLDDIPNGAFICTYAAELLDDADMYGNCDMYYADLDYISVNEESKFAIDDRQDEGVDVDCDDDNRTARRPRFKKIHDLLESHDFTLDARMQGNVGRFFNHSCDPNSMVQNVFTETHDLRFPVIAFFANRVIKATNEITWNYNYKVGSIENRSIYCHCGASNCTGRIL